MNKSAFIFICRALFVFRFSAASSDPFSGKFIALIQDDGSLYLQDEKVEVIIFKRGQQPALFTRVCH